MDNKTIFPVILAGGPGSRLWPLSRQENPKPFLPLTDGRSMLRATYDRAAMLAPREQILAVVAERLRDRVAEELPLSDENILGEPVGRNTAAAIGLAAIFAHTRNPNAVLAVFPADHVIRDEVRFAVLCREALGYAANREVVTIGIAPTRPETGYGYLQLAAAKSENAYRLQRFVEKPDRTTAETFVAEGYLWNSGTFFFRAETLLQAMQEYLPKLYQGLQTLAASAAKSNWPSAILQHFATLESISIDYGIMEKLQNIIAIRGDFGWDDVGTLSAYADLAPSKARVLQVGSRDNCVIGDTNKIVAFVGTEDLILVETETALVICRREESQRIRDLVQLLSVEGLQALL